MRAGMYRFFTGIFFQERPLLDRRIKMNTELLIAAIIGVLLLGYLTYTVVRPEKF